MHHISDITAMLAEAQNTAVSADDLKSSFAHS
jgi:hypothetical protein